MTWLIHKICTLLLSLHAIETNVSGCYAIQIAIITNSDTMRFRTTASRWFFSVRFFRCKCVRERNQRKQNQNRQIIWGGFHVFVCVCVYRYFVHVTQAWRKRITESNKNNFFLSILTYTDTHTHSHHSHTNHPVNPYNCNPIATRIRRAQVVIESLLQQEKQKYSLNHCTVSVCVFVLLPFPIQSMHERPYSLA